MYSYSRSFLFLSLVFCLYFFFSFSTISCWPTVGMKASQQVKTNHCNCMLECAGIFPWTHPLQSACPSHLQAERPTRLNHAAKWKSIYSWMDLSEMPKAYKNNGVCNIISSTPNGYSPKEKISSIRQLSSSMHNREEGAMWTHVSQETSCNQI